MLLAKRASGTPTKTRRGSDAQRPEIDRLKNANWLNACVGK